MQIELIGLCTLLVGVAAFLRGPHAVAAVMIGLSFLGSAAALVAFGSTIQPAHLILGLLFLAVVAHRSLLNRFGAALLPPRAGFWLLGLSVYGIAGAIIFPRLLAGETAIFPIGHTQYGSTLHATPLTPTTGNLTQSIYMMANVVVFASIASIAATEAGLRAVTNGVLAFAIANIAFAFFDIVTFYTGVAWVLDPIRNATYVIHAQTEVGAMKRIVGAFTEASSFARFSLGALAFAATLWLCGRARLWNGGIALLSLIFVAASTASTGVVGLPLVIVLLYATALYLAVSHRRGRAAVALIAAPLVLAGLGAALMLTPDAAASVGGYLDRTLFGKLASESGIERAHWNAVGVQAALETWGLGVGFGTTRTSSFLVALLAACGVVGIIFYALFFSQVAFARPEGGAFRRDIRLAARNACVALLVGDLLVATTTDQGVLFFALAAIAVTRPAYGEK